MPKTFGFGQKRRHKGKLRGRHAMKARTELENREPVPESEAVPNPSNNEEVTVTVDGPFDITVQVQESIGGVDELETSRAEEKYSVFAHLNTTPVEESSCNFIVHNSFLQSLVGAMVCKSCHGSSLHLSKTESRGIASIFSLECDGCGQVWSNSTSPSINGKRQDINYRTVLAMKETGTSLSTLSTLFSIMNLPPPMHHKTFSNIASDIHTAAVDAAEDCMNLAADVIKERHSAGVYVSDIKSPSGVQVCTTSYDGTWQKRGHSSHNGVGVVIDVDSGFVLDTHVVSNYCRVCERGPKPGSSDFEDWWSTHKGVCNKNFDGSSNAMEVEAATKIFPRSIEKRGLIYGVMLCDGDSKSFNKINEIQCYDIEVKKEDCINHIAKRMFNQLETLKRNHKEVLNRRLTKPIIEKLTNTYATNLKKNAPDPQKMKLGVLGGFLHMSSTDSAPNHRLCPTGPDSWCRYNRALSLGEQPPPHRPGIPSDVAPLVYPVIKRLSDPELLSRCARMKTQNANESFNSLIWHRCPKTEYSTKKSVETAVALAILSFNCGPAGLRSVMDKLQIKWEVLNSTHAVKAASIKVQQARKRAVGMSKWKRKNLKRLRLQREHEKETVEGDTYGAGAFNL